MMISPPIFYLNYCTIYFVSNTIISISYCLRNNEIKMLSKSISAINKIWMFGSSQLDKLKKKANITKAQVCFKKTCSKKFCNIHSKTPVLESLRHSALQLYKNETPTQVFLCEYCETFKNICKRLLVSLNDSWPMSLKKVGFLVFPGEKFPSKQILQPSWFDR